MEMNREFLEELGLEKEAIDKVMAEHGKSIQAVKPAEDYEELKKANATYEQQVAKLQSTLDSKEDELGSIEDLKKEIETHKLEKLKTNIAIQANIPLELAGRLSGSTEEEIKADAETMAGFVNKKQTLPLRTTEPPKVDKEKQAYESLVDNLT